MMVRIEQIEGQAAIVVKRGETEQGYFLPPGASDELIDEMMADRVRALRDELLAQCDYVMMADYPIGEAECEAWAGYRQALRDITGQAGFPREVVWPEIQGF